MLLWIWLVIIFAENLNAGFTYLQRQEQIEFVKVFLYHFQFVDWVEERWPSWDQSGGDLPCTTLPRCRLRPCTRTGFVVVEAEGGRGGRGSWYVSVVSTFPNTFALDLDSNLHDLNGTRTDAAFSRIAMVLFLCRNKSSQNDLKINGELFWNI